MPKLWQGLRKLATKHSKDFDTLGLETSKEGEVNGSNMHKYYYDNNNIEKIKNYCEEDVKCTINLVKKLKKLWKIY